MARDTKAKRAEKLECQTKKNSCYYKMDKSPVNKEALKHFKHPAFTAVKHG